MRFPCCKMSKTLQGVNLYLQIFCGLGIVLSIYALNVEIKAEKDKDYKAYCDLSEKISCTKAFSSKWGKGFGIVEKFFGKDSILYQPNSIYGLFFYLLMSGLGLRNNKGIVKAQIILAFISNLLSIYLGHILYSELRDMCLVCIGTYIINVIILAICSIKWNILEYCKCHSGNSESGTQAKTKSVVASHLTKTSDLFTHHKMIDKAQKLIIGHRKLQLCSIP